ncbi:ABC transporter permease [Streptomyces sp. NPDC002054]|uniref:ABC transporter permease n=1 Tax=Streptomyces sp. NPDC002054 TaxID=3154663 RepID=UPI00332B82B3
MSTATAPAPAPAPDPVAGFPPELRPAPTGIRSVTRTFFFILWRDIFVTGREVGTFLAQVLVEPFFILFVFGKVLGELGYTGGNFQQVLLPGVVALNAFLVSLQNTALPLIIDFSWSKEIEDRLLAPIPTTLVAVEKLVFGMLRGIIASLLMIPMGFLILENASWPMEQFPATVGVLLMGALAGSTVGLTIGTLAPPRHISIVFAVTLTPLMFTGCTQFPWHGLADVRWFQVLCAFNPLTYVSEGLRALLLPPGGPGSIPLWVCLPALIAAILIFGAIGIKGFHRRAQD